ncbi:MAG: orotate phosphoribosyltransferase, partial [Bacteroidota bacterium]|nr:orotate phosphoribosyltransferase [Bacteroidota bacterium]
MIYDNKIAHQVAQILLEREAVILKPNNPFTWASGWKSPIYCDNRTLLSFPSERTFIKMKLFELINDKFKNTESIVGVATAGIPHAALVSDLLNISMAYARTKAKDHGRKNIIEGKLDKKDKIVVVEDLISTGKSSFDVVIKLKNDNYKVSGLIAIFTYDFNISKENAENNNIK